MIKRIIITLFMGKGLIFGVMLENIAIGLYLDVTIVLVLDYKKK